jgi:hypothetical protein
MSRGADFPSLVAHQSGLSQSGKISHNSVESVIRPYKNNARIIGGHTGVDWDEVQKLISPVKDFEDLCHRFHVSFAFYFVCAKFNFTIPQLVDYTQKLLLGDTRGRYTGYNSRLVEIITRLDQAGVQNVQDLIEKTADREKLEIFINQSEVSAPDIITVLKYLVYWLIPGEQYLSGLVHGDSEIIEAIKVLRESKVRTNLELLEKGITAAGRDSLAKVSGLSPAMISDLVNRADFSRMPWASKATISNFIGAGYTSLSRLANADPDQLYEDFFRYGKSIGKNLKLGNEIENCYRIARIVPVLLEND